MHRFCSKLGYQIIGGFSKLIKHSNMQSFITYVDLAHFSGEGYKKLGFKEIEITRSNLKWWRNHKIYDLIETKDDYEKIYDAGYLKLQLSTKYI